MNTLKDCRDDLSQLTHDELLEIASFLMVRDQAFNMALGFEMSYAIPSEFVIKAGAQGKAVVKALKVAQRLSEIGAVREKTAHTDKYHRNMN